MSDFTQIVGILVSRDITHGLDRNNGKPVIILYEGDSIQRGEPVATLVFGAESENLCMVTSPFETMSTHNYSHLTKLCRMSLKELREAAYDYTKDKMIQLKRWKREDLIPFLYSIWLEKQAGKRK